MFASSSGEEAKKLFNDAQDMLKTILETESLQPTGVVAFFPANSVGDDVHIFEDDNKREGSPRAVFYGLRQQVGKRLHGHMVSWSHGFQGERRGEQSLPIEYEEGTEIVDC